MDLRDRVSRVFQSYDMRGIYPDEITPDIAYRVGRALAAYLDEAMRVEEPRVAIGRDMRLGSDQMANAVTLGLQAGGARRLHDVLHGGTIVEEVGLGEAVDHVGAAMGEHLVQVLLYMAQVAAAEIADACLDHTTPRISVSSILPEGLDSCE